MSFGCLLGNHSFGGWIGLKNRRAVIRRCDRCSLTEYAEQPLLLIERFKTTSEEFHQILTEETPPMTHLKEDGNGKGC
jgi:hypothetical protein